ncbi:MAG: RNA polymerase sigma factor [bacterium]
MSTFKEKILLVKINSKDEKAFAEVYDLYMERIYRFIFFKVSNIEDAEDIASEVFFKAWQYIRDGKEVNSINGFLYSIARNKVIDYYRKNSKVKQISLDHSDAEKIKDDKGEDVEKKIDTEIGFEKLNGFLEKLKAEYREALLLRYVDDLSIPEIAEILGKSNGNIRVLIHRALEALREMMENSPNSPNF